MNFRVFARPGLTACSRHLMLAGTALSLVTAVPALAQPIAPTSSEAARSFDIPSQPLRDALRQLMQQGSLQIGFEAVDVDGKTSSAVSGSMSAGEALSQLLAGTGLTFRYLTSGSVVLEPAPQSVGGAIQLGPVRVEGNQGENPSSAEVGATGPVPGFVARRSATGTKTDTPISETPQSISIVTRDNMEARGARTLGAALSYNAGVISGLRGESSSISDDNIIIRGFGGTGSSNEYWDGLRVLATNYASSGIDPYLFERVEVLRGPASVLYGQAQPGGMVNSVSKRPLDTPGGEVRVLFGSFDTKELDADITGPIGDTGRLSYRLTGVLSDQDAQADFSGRERKVVMPSLTWHPSSRTHLTLQAVYQDDDVRGGNVKTFPAIGTLSDTAFGRIPRSRFVGDPNYDLWDREIVSLAYFLDHRFNENWSFRQNLRYMNTQIKAKMAYGISLQADNRTVNRSLFGLYEQADVLSVDNQLDGRFATGLLQHHLLVGFDFQERDATALRRFSAGPTLDLYAPTYFQTIAEPPVFQSLAEGHTRLGIYFQDQIKVDGLILTVGGRYDWSESRSNNRLTSIASKVKDDAFTGRVGLGYAFAMGLTPYVSFSQSFEPQSGVDFSGNRFDPRRGEQIEAGVKYDVPGSNVFLTLSAYDLTQQNVLTPDPNHPGFNVQTGEVRSRGIEFEGTASIASGWDVIASYTYLDQTVTKSNGSDLGKRLVTVPRHVASLWSGYTFQTGPLAGFNLGGGIRYVGDTVGDRLNTFKVPSYTLFDASLSYDLSALDASLSGWNLSVNATNLADKTYVASCGSAVGCYYGVGRSVIGRLGYRW